MLKTAKILKTQAFETAGEALRAALGRVPTARVLGVQRDPRGCRAQLRTEDREDAILVRTVARPDPRPLREALAALVDDASRETPRATPVVFAEFLSDAARQLCKDLGVGFVDAYGNCRLVLGPHYLEVLIYSRPKDGRVGTLKSLFAPASARALRVLLEGPPRAWKTEALTAAGHLSAGTAANVRRLLIDQEWAEETPEGLRLTKPDALLDAWEEADNFGKRTTVQEFSTLTIDPAELAGKIHRYLVSAETKHAFTQWYAASLRRPHATVPAVSVYVEKTPDVDALCKSLLARPVDSGGRLRLIYSKDPGVFTPSQTVNGLPLVSDTQIYLDLIKAGLRGDEAAKELRTAPDFAGGSK